MPASIGFKNGLFNTVIIFSKMKLSIFKNIFHTFFQKKTSLQRALTKKGFYLFNIKSQFHFATVYSACKLEQDPDCTRPLAQRTTMWFLKIKKNILFFRSDIIFRISLIGVSTGISVSAAYNFSLFRRKYVLPVEILLPAIRKICIFHCIYKSLFLHVI